MGYYVDIEDCSFFLAKEKFDEAYQILCKFNDRDDLKRGGGGSFTLPNGEKMKYGDPRPEGMSYHPMKWFSWMDPNYPEVCKDLFAILTMLGFDYHLDDDGNICSLSYSSKIGSESDFLNEIAHLVKKDSWIIWNGEDGQKWRDYFDGEKMIEEHAEITWVRHENS